MYFWNYRQLAGELREGFISDQNFVIYLAIFIIQIALVAVFGITSATDLHITLMVSSFWVVFCYLINKKGDGQYFVTRLVCLDLPITIQAFVFQLALAVTYHVIAEFYTPLKAFVPALDNVVVWIGMLYMFWLYYISFRIASKQTP